MSRVDEQRQGLHGRVVPGVRQHPGFVSGTWMLDRDAGTSVVVITFTSRAELLADLAEEGNPVGVAVLGLQQSGEPAQVVDAETGIAQARDDPDPGQVVLGVAAPPAGVSPDRADDAFPLVVAQRVQAQPRAVCGVAGAMRCGTGSIVRA